MMRRTSLHLAQLGVVAVLGVAANAPLRNLAGQISDRVRSVRDGTVRMSFAARPGVCWYGNGGRYSVSDRSDRYWEFDCEEGPVRVALDVRDGEYVDIHTYVGGRWRRGRGLDLGDVAAASAAGFLLDIARTSAAPVADKAILPATLADSVTVWPALADLARDRSRPRSVREAAVFWMGQTDDVATVRMLHEIMETETDWPVREKAVFALSQHESDSAGRVLFAIAEGADYETRMRGVAIFWLGQRRHDGGQIDLRALYDRLENPELRERIIFAMAQRGGVENERWVLQIALDRGQPVSLRKQAIFWAGQNGDDVTGLISAYDQIEEPSLREHVIFTLSQRHRDPAALDKLIDIAARSTDVGLRGKAIFWLGQSRDPRAIGFLEELIRR